MNAELPKDFFSDVHQAKAAPANEGPRALRWYDGIIDDILANPGTTVADTAKRLGRHPNTISAITNSDLFRARWEQRRAQFSMALDLHLSQKLASVAEKALDHTIEVLDKKRDTIPLPILKDLALGSLDRLGYGPKSQPPATAVQVNVNAGVASPEALERARNKMRELELKAVDGREAAARQSALPEFGREATGRESSPPVAGLKAEPSPPALARGEPGEGD